MKKQVFNPFLPLDTYIPDGEPHVFGSRVYLFGSHDKEGGKEFCQLPYQIWSAPVDDLSDWSNQGFNYSGSQDPLAEGKRTYLYAPDCVRGNDGRYYLYYCLNCYEGPIGVAVSSAPDGRYKFYGHVKNKDGSDLHSFVPFDPALINDEGVIRLYYGTWYPFDELPGFLHASMLKVQAMLFKKTPEDFKKQDNMVMGPVSCTLEDDMLTVKAEPKLILPYKTKGTPFESRLHPLKKDGHLLSGHGFYEGSSIRKVNGTYYFIYSSVNNHELCYATSKFPDREFTYRGTIVSNGDVGYLGHREKDRVNFTATNHGSIENINGDWYVFYHRQTNGSDYSRQACAEKIRMEKDGTIKQVEITSCGLNGKPLEGNGTYPAVICCNLTNGHMPHGGNMEFKGLPRVTFDGQDRFLADIKAGTLVRYKYFDLSKTHSLSIRARGKGTLEISNGQFSLGSIKIDSPGWASYPLDIKEGPDKSLLEFKARKGQMDILDFIFSK